MEGGRRGQGEQRSESSEREVEEWEGRGSAVCVCVCEGGNSEEVVFTDSDDCNVMAMPI
jgi:hypothetical protein